VDTQLQQKLGLPSNFDDRYLINFSIITDKPKSVRHSGEDTLTEAELLDFRKVLHLYENFIQKKRYSRLLKLKQVRFFMFETKLIL
jgi:hypothetical protein